MRVNRFYSIFHWPDFWTSVVVFPTNFYKDIFFTYCAVVCMSMVRIYVMWIVLIGGHLSQQKVIKNPSTDRPWVALLACWRQHLWLQCQPWNREVNPPKNTSLIELFDQKVDPLEQPALQLHSPGHLATDIRQPPHPQRWQHQNRVSHGLRSRSWTECPPDRGASKWYSFASWCGLQF